jgi:hypothetical protein
MRYSAFGIMLCCTLAAFSSFARSKSKIAPKDSFDFVAHLALTGGAVTSLVTTSHFGRNYLYAESLSSHTVTLFDVTDFARPKVLSRMNSSDSVLTAAGDAVLVSSDSSAAVPGLKKISIIDVSDKSKPKIVREFAGVTSMTADAPRGLVFLANADGLWILHQNQPIDPEIQERYAHDVLYSH